MDATSTTVGMLLISRYITSKLYFHFHFSLHLNFCCVLQMLESVLLSIAYYITFSIQVQLLQDTTTSKFSSYPVSSTPWISTDLGIGAIYHSPFFLQRRPGGCLHLYSKHTTRFIQQGVLVLYIFCSFHFHTDTNLSVWAIDQSNRFYSRPGYMSMITRLK